MKTNSFRDYPYFLLILFISLFFFCTVAGEGLAAVSTEKVSLNTKAKANSQTTVSKSKSASKGTAVQSKTQKKSSQKAVQPPAKKETARKKAVPKEAAKKSTSTSKKGGTQTRSSSKQSSKQSAKKLVVLKKGQKKGKIGRAAVRTYARSVSHNLSSIDGRDLHLNVKSALLINMTTGSIYYEQDPDEQIPPASITKVLTLYLIRDAIARGEISPSTMIPVSGDAVNTGGSRMRLKRGEKVPLAELIKGISIVSANNACVAVAEYFGKGDISRFVAQMNTAAKRIGMTNSRFKNPNGLPAPGQVSTARDIAKLSMNYLRNFPESLAIHSMTTHTFNGATHHNANSLLRTYPGADGLKTGFVCASGYNITATAKRGNTRLVAVLLGAQNSVIRAVETARLLNYGFDRAAAEHGIATNMETKSKS